MKLPKKINPDRIKDSIVEVKFSSTLPYEVYLGLIYQSLDASYKYTNRPSSQKNFPLPMDGPREIKLTFGNVTSLFFNDFIKFEIQPGSIIFNCVEKYITWDLFQPEIQKVLNQIFASKVVDIFTRVGIRYISEYPESEIKDITKFSFTFGMPDVNSENYSFRSEFKKANCRVIINLLSRIPLINHSGVKNTISSIDIDVIKEDFETNSLKTLFDMIDDVHTIEKESFFNLLSENFLKTLNPTY